MAAPATTVFLLTELVEKCLGSRVHTVLFDGNVLHLKAEESQSWTRFC
uniref:Uncharacterized protein n=1 Tax=Otus sunia TaxID=257818 RepID=A0A8C8B384_9STRI